MDDIPSYLLIIACTLIVLSMLFSISESAFLGMNKLRLRLRKKNKDKRAIRASKLLEKKDHLINTLLISNDLVNIFLSSIITSIALQMVGQKGVGYATFIATLLLLIFGEITPKTIATHCPDKIAYGLSGFVRIVVILMYPLVFVITKFSRIVLRILGIKINSAKKTYSEEDIKTFFEMSTEHGVIEENENRMMSQIFKFSDLEAQDIMVPRTKIKAVSSDSSYASIIELSQIFGFTRFPVYKDSIDDIIGIIYLKDMLLFKNHPNDFKITKVMRPPLFILGTKKMSSVQEMLFQNRQSMAIVVDEYSGTYGVVTEKDISREIFALPGDNSLRGKVFDIDSVENKDDFEINGAVLLKVIKNALYIPLESEMNETIGGWFTEKLNRMPLVNDSLEFEGYLFTVKKIQSHRIERMQIKKIEQGEE